MVTTTASSQAFSASDASAPRSPGRFVALIAPGALVAATLDGAFAVGAFVLVLHRYSVVGALQYIASGLLGSAAFSGGLPAAALGAVIHLSLAFAFAGLYALVARGVPALRRTGGAAAGLAFGASIWVVMSYLVLPLSGVPKGDDGALFFWAFLVDHALCVGLPIATLTHARLRATEGSPV